MDELDTFKHSFISSNQLSTIYMCFDKLKRSKFRPLHQAIINTEWGAADSWCVKCLWNVNETICYNHRSNDLY